MIITDYEISPDVCTNRFDFTVRFSCEDFESVKKLKNFLSNLDENYFYDILNEKPSKQSSELKEKNTNVCEGKIGCESDDNWNSKIDNSILCLDIE